MFRTSNRKRMSSSQELEEESLIPGNVDDILDESNEIRIQQPSQNSIKSNFLNYSKKVNWYVFFLISFYTACSTYSSIGGIWTELPFMVDQLKEGWRLPAILTGTGQVAQLGTMVNFAFHLFYFLIYFRNKFLPFLNLKYFTDEMIFYHFDKII